MRASDCDVSEAAPASPWPFDNRVENGLSDLSMCESFVEVGYTTFDV